jgi:hypothetical protein
LSSEGETLGATRPLCRPPRFRSRHRTWIRTSWPITASKPVKNCAQSVMATLPSAATIRPFVPTRFATVRHGPRWTWSLLSRTLLSWKADGAAPLWRGMRGLPYARRV